MKCPKCSARNGETNKFCRECGFRLEEPAKQQAPQDANLPDDELALGEELFDVWQLYSAGELDEALEKVEKVTQASPNSASAHSIMALIFERKAQKASDAGYVDTASELLEEAIAHYETIVELNPNSGADREKLASLRLRLTGERPAPPVPASVKPLDLGAAFRAVPTPWKVAGAAFLIVLMIGIVAFPSGRKEPVRAKPERVSSGLAPEPRAAAVPTPPPPRVYTFAAPAQSVTPSPIKSQSPAAQNTPSGLPPLSLPQIGGVTIVPMDQGKPKDAKKGASAQPKQGATKEETKPKPAPTGPDGASMLAQAIEQHDQGRTSEAIASAMEAQGLFQNEIDAGKNPATARRGLENARKMIQIWREAEAPSGEQ